MCSVGEPTYLRAAHLVKTLERERDGADILDAEQAREIGATVAQFALCGHHPVLLARLLRAIEVPAGVVYESVMEACDTDGDRAAIWAELFLDDGARAAISGESTA